MSEIKLCRICLDNNIRMHQISGSDVQDVYEKLTNNKVQDDIVRYFACYICYRQLHKCRQLIIKSQKSEELLKHLFQNTHEADEKYITVIDRRASGLLNTLSVATTESYSIVDEIDNVAKIEVEVDSAVVKNEIEEKVTVQLNLETEQSNVMGDFSDGPGSDSEDDLPLKSISTRYTDRKVKVKKKHKKRSHKDLIVDAHEVLLSKEQQLDQLLQRSKSMNYTSSPYKCEMCFKGFLMVNAYENHKRKHDARSGSYECEICRMRYKSERLLRTHASTAHARLYRCNKCTHVSHTANQAREHEKWHNGYTYECQLCGQKFRKPTSYLTHKRKCHPTEHICCICGESFVGKHGLLMHKSKTHKWDQQTPVDEESMSDRFCVDCNIQFVTVKAWKRHILTSIKHTLDNNGSQCKICDKKISEDMPSHMKEHEKSLRCTMLGAKKHIKLACDQCDAYCLGRANLKAHVRRVHLGLKYNKNVVCEVCGRKCTSNATLKYHQRTHTGERPYSCNECGKRFPDSNQLRIHNRTHTGERPYCCTVCDKRFSQKPALNRHYRVHTGVKPYECQFCSKSFNQSNSMKLHVNTVHLKLPNKKKAQNESTEKNEVVAYITGDVGNRL